MLQYWGEGLYLNSMTDVLKILRDYFPTAIYTGRSLIFISEDSRVEMTECSNPAMTADKKTATVRVRLFAKNEHGEFEPGHYEDFSLPDISDLAGEIEKFVQFAVGKNIKE